MEIIDKFVARKIESARKKRGYTQEKVAQKISLSRQQYQRLENASTSITISKLFKLSQILSVSVSYFLEGLEEYLESVDAVRYNEHNASNNLSILIVEDNVSDFFLTKKAILEFDPEINISTVSDGHEAIEYLRGNITQVPYSRPDVILLDINIPKKNGLEVIKAIKLDKTIKTIPVIIVTNSIDMDEIRRLYSYGASGHVIKSFTPKVFYQNIANVLEYWSSMKIVGQSN